ncbi:MAG: tRNA-dihydrouridine synthase family protein [Eubacteriales bacterium]|nr:tRNA-dihydrouridine synthase family protein [Eubacteriales bacterium]
MKYYYAPMEGITGYLHRNVCHSFFSDIDKYFTPFLAPNQTGRLSSKEKNDILPEHNEGIFLVPQILANQAESFLAAERTLKGYGYRELNLNLGCPSKTVVSKYRGSGFLAKPEELDHFLEEIFSRTECRISIKTRIGRDDREEFLRLLEIYNKYPLEELIVHPRTQKDFYKGTPDWDMFAYAAANSRNPLCYNGDIFSGEIFGEWKERFPQTDMVMMGRGLLINPGLVGFLKDGQMPSKDTIREFQECMYQTYREHMPGDKVVLFKMKELWLYLIQIFTEPKKYAKRIRKAEKLPAYEDAVRDLFAEQEIVPYGERIFQAK